MHAVLGHSLMRLSCLPRLCGSGILECTRISCSLRLRREPILKPASCRHLVVSEAPRRSQWLLRIVWKTWFSGWWVKTRKEGLVTVAGSTSSLVSSSDARGKLSDEAVGMPLDRSWVLSWARALSRAVCISWAEGLFQADLLWCMGSMEAISHLTQSFGLQQGKFQTDIAIKP